VDGSELAEVLREVLVRKIARMTKGYGMLLCRGDLIGRVLAEQLVLWPVLPLAFGGTVLSDHATTAETKAAGIGGFDLSTSIT